MRAVGRTSKTRLVTVLAVLTAAVGTGIGVAGIASAASCPSTYACGWKDSGFGTPRGQWAGTNPNFQAFGQPACQTNTWNDCISSDANEGTQCTVHFFNDAGYLGGEHSVGRGVFESYVGDSFNDRFSSNNWC
jgi:hypothetical protein